MELVFSCVSRDFLPGGRRDYMVQIQLRWECAGRYRVVQVSITVHQRGSETVIYGRYIQVLNQLPTKSVLILGYFIISLL